MDKLKRIIAFIMCFVMLAASLQLVAFAEEKTYTGTVDVDPTSSLSVRKDPIALNDYSNMLGRLNLGDSVIIHGGKVSGINGDKNEWYKIEYAAAEGGFAYVCADYIINVTEIIPPAEYVPDATFEENLENQGFPESYKVLLRKLHAAHPNWIFLADHINLTWDEVLAAESGVGKNLVSTYRPESYRSMEYGAYNWNTNTYVNNFDGSNWVSPHRDIVAYYLEPRNFLNENSIFQFLDQTYNEKVQNAEGVNKIVANSFMSGAFPEDSYDTYTDILMYAGKTGKVSPYVLAAMIIQEQGRDGTNPLITGTTSGYEGFYNFFNIGAYSSGSLTAVQRGLAYARGDYSSDANKAKYQLPWNSRTRSIIGGAIYYGNGYVDAGQDTLYYKKFDVIGPNYYNNQYMTNIEGANSEAILMKNAYANSLDDDILTFNIPVYKNMPSENKTSLPTSNGANNYYLKDLSIKDVSITPTFDMYKKNYETVVDYSVSKINVSATAVDGATVSGTGEHNLKVGENVITLTVTAASGKTSDYKISVTRREGQGETVIPDPEVTTDYLIGDYLTGVQPVTTVNSFKQKITLKNGKLKIYNSSGAEKTTGNICTGDKIKIFKTDDNLFLEKTIVIYGDANGDGKLSGIDVIMIQKHMVGLESISGISLVSADVNRDKKLGGVDVIMIQKHMVGISNVQQ